MATITKVDVSQTMIMFHLSDHRIRGFNIADPVVAWLYSASMKEREAWDIVDKGTVASWPALNFQVSVEQMG